MGGWVGWWGGGEGGAPPTPCRVWSGWVYSGQGEGGRVCGNRCGGVGGVQGVWGCSERPRQPGQLRRRRCAGGNRGSYRAKTPSGHPGSNY